MPPQPAPPNAASDFNHLQLALQQAQHAAALGEVPVGAIITSPQGDILAQAHNRTRTTHDPCAHAEILALRAAAQRTGNHRLQDCTLYVTLEPCPMCAGAILHARLRRVIYAVADPKTGAAGSVINLFANPQLNHHTQATLFAPASAADAALQTASAALLTDFFRQRRASQAQQSQQPAQAALRDNALRPCPSRFAHIPALQALQPFSQWALLQEPPSSTPTANAAATDNTSPHTPQRPWRLHYIDTAPHQLHQPQRPTILLLHGYASYHLLWADTIAPLHQAGWRVLAPDLLGQGLSDQPKKPQQHTLHWHSALLQQWLAQIHVTPSPQHTMLLHDSAIQLAPTLASTFPHCLTLVPTLPASPAPHTPWRTHCQHRPSFNLDTHWADTPEEQAQYAWQAPYPNPGHRAALLAPFWANPSANPPASPAASPAAATGAADAASHTFFTIATPHLHNGAALRHWLRHNSNTLLAHLPTNPSSPTPPQTTS